VQKRALKGDSRGDGINGPGVVSRQDSEKTGRAPKCRSYHATVVAHKKKVKHNMASKNSRILITDQEWFVVVARCCQDDDWIYIYIYSL
jgi:hypothetical protein